MRNEVEYPKLIMFSRQAISSSREKANQKRGRKALADISSSSNISRTSGAEIAFKNKSEVLPEGAKNTYVDEKLTKNITGAERDKIMHAIHRVGSVKQSEIQVDGRSRRVDGNGEDNGAGVREEFLVQVCAYVYLCMCV